MWIVEDEYDSEYRYTGAPIASLQSQDRAGSVLYVGTMSKVLFPGLRLGYIVVPPALVDVFARGKAAIDRHTAVAPQIVLADFIAEGHFLRHIKRTRQVYAERREALLAAAGSYLGEVLDLGPSDAGFHVATAFRGKGGDKAVTAAALERGVELRPLSAYYEAVGMPREALSPQGLLLGFAAATPEEIRRAAPVLARVLKEHIRYGDVP
jgi:GntR family transcriptional regulator / MocR family aminotransferase